MDTLRKWFLSPVLGMATQSSERFCPSLHCLKEKVQETVLKQMLNSKMNSLLHFQISILQCVESNLLFKCTWTLKAFQSFLLYCSPSNFGVIIAVKLHFNLRLKNIHLQLEFSLFYNSLVWLVTIAFGHCFWIAIMFFSIWYLSYLLITWHFFKYLYTILISFQCACTMKWAIWFL